MVGKCIACLEDGAPCGRLAMVIDEQRGGLVCEAHRPGIRAAVRRLETDKPAAQSITVLVKTEEPPVQPRTIRVAIRYPEAEDPRVRPTTALVWLPDQNQGKGEDSQ